MKTWTLKIKWPANPVGVTIEYAYGETVTVTDGVCSTSDPATVDYLIACNYEVIDVSDDEVISVSGDEEEPDGSSVQAESPDHATVRRPRGAAVGG